MIKKTLFGFIFLQDKPDYLLGLWVKHLTGRVDEKASFKTYLI